MPNVVVRRPPFRKRGQAWLPLSDPQVRNVTGAGGVVFGGTADVEFVHTQVASDIVIEWDFDNDGDFGDPLEEITGYVMAAETLSGRDWASNLTGKAQAGQLRLTLRNDDDRFSFFNTASPLAADPFSLRTGRKIRVRTAESTPVDPVLLARDRFNRADSSTLGTAETGQTWQATANGGFQIEDNMAVCRDGPADVVIISAVDCGEVDHYVQATIGATRPNMNTGLVARLVDDENYLLATARSDDVFLLKVVANVETEIATAGFQPWDGVTLGLGCVGDQITVYVAGVPVISETVSDLLTGTQVGMLGFLNAENMPQAVEVDDFHVWDRVGAEIDGVIWTGNVVEVHDSLSVAGVKTTVVSAEGVLARAALAEIKAPRPAQTGTPTGVAVGDTMARAGLMLPPAPGGLDLGTVEMGPLGVDDGRAFDIARLFEESERGFLHETNEGAIGFQDADARAAATPVVQFSDLGSAGQFGYAEIAPLDHDREIVNRVTAGVAPSEPTGITFTTREDIGSVGVQNHTDVLLPSTAAGDFLIVFVRRSNQTSGVNWLTPFWWDNHRPEEPDAIVTRVYSHRCDGTESGDTIRFYTDSASAGGSWIAMIVKIEEWYLSVHGTAMVPFVEGLTPQPLVHNFGLASTAYIVCLAGGEEGGGGTFPGPLVVPSGYSGGDLESSGDDVIMWTAYRIACTESEAPDAFGGITGWPRTETTIFAVRGFNGEHGLQGTIKNPTQFVATPGRFVTLDDEDSQREHNVIRAHVAPSNLFATEADAGSYCDAVLETYADDRPIVSISFYATTSNAYRAQAVRRRVGDMITLTANGATGLGIDGDFFIENIGHHWSQGAKLWTVTWVLSPA